MKYKCIKNYWMEDEFEHTGHTPAFLAGEVYEFNTTSVKGSLVTSKDNNNEKHYMPVEELNDSGYFKSVEENVIMSNKQWLEGATYQLRKDMVDEFESKYGSNEEIAAEIGDKTFTVKKVGQDGRVYELVEFHRDDLSIDYWFNVDEMDYFDMVVDLRDVIKANNVQPASDIIAEWLNKLSYVMLKDNSILSLNSCIPAIYTDYGDIIGATNIVEFINTQYDILQSEAKQIKHKELIERKAKLEAELMDIDKELEE